MKPKWTGALVGKMHVWEISYEALARKLGVTKGYVGQVLNGRRRPADARSRLETAVDEMIQERKNKV